MKRRNCLNTIKLKTEDLIIRSGVEDTRLEAKAKAKDTKKKNPRPRPRTAFPRTDTLEAKDRNARGQGQECSRPRPRTKDTSASALQKKKKVFTKKLANFRGQANFRGLEASRPRPRTSKCVLEDSTSVDYVVLWACSRLLATFVIRAPRLDGKILLRSIAIRYYFFVTKFHSYLNVFCFSFSLRCWLHFVWSSALACGES